MRNIFKYGEEICLQSVWGWMASYQCDYCANEVKTVQIQTFYRFIMF